MINVLFYVDVEIFVNEEIEWGVKYLSLIIWWWFCVGNVNLYWWIYLRGIMKLRVEVVF